MGRLGHTMKSVLRAVLAAVVALGAAEARAQAELPLSRPLEVPTGALIADGGLGLGQGGTRLAARPGTEDARSATADERAAGPLRRRSGGESLDRSLRRRLDEEERRRTELIDEQNERRLRELFRDTDAISGGSPCFGGDPLEAPSAAFLRAVSPPRLEFVTHERRGFDRWAAREIQGEWRRRYEQDVENWRDEHPRHWEYELDALNGSVERAFDDAWVARWKAPFPTYWDGHPGASRPQTVVTGENIDIFRVGPFVLANDLDLRYDVLDSVLATALPEPDVESHASAVRPAHATFFAEHPHGNLYTADFFALDTKVRLGAGLTSMQTGFIREVGTELLVTFFSPYDRRRICRVELSFGYDARQAESSAALMVSLLHY